MHSKTVSALIAALMSTTALAQAGGSATASDRPAATQHARQLPPEGKRWVDGFVGKWKSKNVKITSGDKDTPGAMTMSCTRASGGWAALCKATFTAAGMRPEDDTYLMGWDVGAKQAHMFEVTSMAEVHDHVGTWSDDRSITLVHRGKSAEGQDEEASLTFTWPSRTRIDAKGTGKVGGKTTWTMSATFAKK
jgi:hypothetical protein